MSISANVNTNTYLGAKGYTIYKECMEPADLKILKDELNVRAYVPTSPIQAPSFPVYREAPKKIYIPRYYGIHNYGPPEEIKIPQGTDINIDFKGELRDYQNNIIDIYVKHTDKVWGGGGLLEIPCGRGKTVIALKIIATLKKKTLVIVHKGFLLNQWIERIEQFLPTAKVGRIQGQTLDIECKDIVIGMLQSLSMKEYPEDLFAQFGLTIVDECHHISSEVFSRSLQKIITFYTLGLSATMQRKDGLSKVFKMFLGDIVYKEKREDDDPVLVKAIEFKSTNVDFNTMCFDYRGNPAYSTMISKLCEFSHRSEFILKVIEHELTLKTGQQMMILAHNKNILTYIYKAIEHRKIATVGYYVGGMKEADLKKSETCQVIIATYAMAAEALDIKTLTTLLLATPKTDIIQAVGRILRVKHERPLVIDIIDTHEVFIKQWQKRRKYYASNKYKILHTNSKLYEASISVSEASVSEASVSEANKASVSISKASIWKTLTDSTIKCEKKTDDVYVSTETLMKGKCLINI
jgi:superfamily II DNA or RNA helicase